VALAATRGVMGIESFFFAKRVEFGHQWIRETVGGGCPGGQERHSEDIPNGIS
jgi:hypothetical protein